MEELQMVIESITGTITMQEMVLEEMEARLESGLSLSEYSERCMEIEKQKGLIMGLKSAITTASFTKTICANKKAVTVEAPVEVEAVAVEEVVVEAVAVEAPVAINSIAKVAVSSVVSAHNAVMEEVAKIPGLKENATVRFYEDGTRVHFKDAYSRYDFTMVITERADGKINYRLEEQSTVPYGRRRRNKDLSSLASVMKFIAAY